MLLAAYNARRPTADADALARHIADDQDAVVARICRDRRPACRRRWCRVSIEQA